MSTRRAIDHKARSRRGALLAAFWTICIVLSGSAFAHQRSTPETLLASGISIPNLSHGQMGVIARNLSAILALAEQDVRPDTTTQRLHSFVNLQYFFCMRGLVPGSLTDEASPFNECTHAYLAGARALLVHLKSLPGRQAAVDLAGRIELQMLANSTSLILCQYSDERFNTAAVLSPHWSDIPSHPPSLAAFGGTTLVLVACGWLMTRRPAGPDSRDSELA
jgi:hypothetical protein